MKLIREFIDEILQESPQRISGLKIQQLEDPRLNKKLYKKIAVFIPQAKLLETTSTGIELFQTVKNNEYEIFALDPEQDRVAYYVRYEIQSAEFVDVDWATQVLVWRGTASSTKTTGLLEHVFFKYVLPAHDVVVSDGEQTSYGERFWKLRIEDSFLKPGLKIYLIDFHQKTVKRFKTRSEYERLLNTKNDPWGDTGYHKGLRIAIANFDLVQE